MINTHTENLWTSGYECVMCGMDNGKGSITRMYSNSPFKLANECEYI